LGWKLSAEQLAAKRRNMSQPNISETQIRRAAAEGRLDPRTVRNLIAGGPSKPIVRERALEALRAVGVAELTLEEIVAAKGDGRRLGEVADSRARVAQHPPEAGSGAR
jgi:hypothetical protein